MLDLPHILHIHTVKVLLNAVIYSKSQVETSIEKAIRLKKLLDLVPTMGSLHQGHSLAIKKSRPEL